MKKIGILGGTFDPPHIGHLIIANEVREYMELDEIRFMPNNVPPHKTKTSTTNRERFDMLTLAIGTNPYLNIDTIEWERTGPSYTIDTIKLMKEREGDSEIYFIIGADMIEYLPKWKDIDELSQLVRFIGVRRPGYSTETSYPVKLVDIPEIAVSSSWIRSKISKGKTINYLVPEAVKLYIEENRLYGSKKSTGIG